MPFEKISHQLSVLSYLMRDTREAVRRTETAAHQTNGKVDSLADRVDRIEDRELAKRSVSTGQEWTPRDYIIAAGAGIVLVLSIFGKIPWPVVQSVVSALK